MAPLTSALWDHFRWKLYEHTQGGSREVDALISVVRKYLTPTPTSTNIERLFSYAGRVLEDKRARLSPEKLDQIIFLWENIILSIFELDWD